LRKSGHGGNTTHVAVVASHPDVTCLTPRSSPRVLDDPIVSARGRTPADGEDTVIELGGAAVGVRVNSAAVELEGGLRGIDGDGGRAEVDFGLQVVLVTSVDVDVGSQGSSNVLLAERASSILSSVGVALFGVNTLVVNDVLHGLSHETTITSLVSFIAAAVNEVLLRKRDELLGFELVATLG